MLLVVTTGLCVVALAIVYMTVLGDAFGTFPLPVNSPPSSGYLESPYWLGIAPNRAVVGLQMCGFVGYSTWVAFVVSPTSTMHISNLVLLLASITWPFAAWKFLHDRRWVLVVCISLWVAATAMLLLVTETIRTQTSPLPLLALSPAAVTVVLLDGVVWSASAIFYALSSTSS